ncbi:hypothetical protein ANANG_G00199640 [Anguilla anguilla]|uniref:DNA helicase n=1 Tax=Anguilla anguilla TaxID=7936 RepID=A0A9D3RTM4_ANGAN|nr:hypothetical protein ANANG_G00199640 [Anguilla anguilla]
MSLFNLDRFRYGAIKTSNKIQIDTTSPVQEQHSSWSSSPDSEKENKPIPETPVHKRPFGKKQGREDELEEQDSDSEDSAGSRADMPDMWTEACHGVESTGLWVFRRGEDEETEEKVSKLQEIFPQRDRQQLLEIAKSTSTLPGAVASCLMMFGDDDPDSSRKRKLDGSGDSSQDGDAAQPSKRRRPSAASDSDREGAEPNWEKQEAMVKRLQRKFPDLDKEELRAVLEEHDWDCDDALEVLRLFSDQDEESSSPEAQEKKPKAARSSRDARPSDARPRKVANVPAAVAARALGKAERLNSRGPERARRAGKAQAAERRRAGGGEDGGGRQLRGRGLGRQRVRGFLGGGGGGLDSDCEDGVGPQLRGRILAFFQEASLDELSLIAGCSVKKAQKIAELRPFRLWRDLEEVFHKANGLSMELVWGCRLVLKEREVVLGLMGKCETIARRMMEDVTRVIERGVGSMKQPSVLNSRLQLKPYQLIGLNWLVLLHQHKLSGILADEMGLGKTIQAISFLASLYQDGNTGPHLIIVPSSTLDNWVRELKLWCPSLAVLVYYGSAEDRRYLRHDILSKEVEFNIIVTTYNTAIGNEYDRSLFRKLRLEYAVFDEGHMLKNMNSMRYRHLMAINAHYRLLLTGTPLQNNLLELMSLLNFIMPTMFSSSTSQIAKMFSMKSAEEKSSFEQDRIAHAKLIMKPFILRRVKSEVLKQLPDKEERLEFCPMSEKQQELYSALFQRSKPALS